MPGIIILILLSLLVFFISRKNYTNRANNLSTNFDEFNKLIRKKYENLSDINKKEFLNFLDKDLYMFFDNIVLGKSTKVLNNTWTIQQRMMKQQEIIKIFKKLEKK